MSSSSASGGRRLSEVARHVLLPEGIAVDSFGPVERRTREMGIEFDEWQRGLSKAVLAKRADGLYACGIGGAVISIPRQTGKTFTVGALVFALCSLNPNMLVIWTAHRTRTHNETFRSMAAMAERPDIRPHVAGVRRANGEQEVEFTNGSRILFGAREQGFGRGFAKVDILVLDEAQILTERAMEDMVPATNAAPNGLVLMMGTPPRPSDPGEVFAGRRAAVLDGDPDTLYVEFSADKGANPDDREQWRKANPSFPRRTKESAILRMRKLLGSAESFLREGLGIWDEAAMAKTAISATDWASRKITPELIPTEGRKVFGVKFAIDGSSVALAGGLRPEGADVPVHVAAIRQEPTSEGTQWLLDFLLDRADETAQIVIDGKSGTGYLVNALRDGGVPAKAILTPGGDDAVAAHSMIDNAITTGGMTHEGQPELDAQVEAAVRRKIGTNGGFGWAAPEGGSVVMFDAVTLAYWGAKVTRRRPGRKAVLL